MIRNVLGMVAGYLVFAVPAALLAVLARKLSLRPGVGTDVAGSLCGVLLALAGGYVAAALTRRQGLLHGVGVAILIAAGAAVSLVMQGWGGRPWVELSVIFLLAPWAILGGWLREKRSRVKSSKRAP